MLHSDNSTAILPAASPGFFAFQRVTSGQRFIPQIDGLRFVAIVSVFLFHLHSSIAHNGRVGSPLAAYDAVLNMYSKRGVELFFVISGFILSLPFAKARLLASRPVSLKDYFLRRLTRLEPPYFVNLVICSLALVLAKQASAQTVARHFLPSLLYIHRWVYGDTSILNGVTWSLEVEVEFYLLVPLLTAVFFIRNTSLRRSVLAATILIWSLVSNVLTDGPFRLTILYYLPLFLAGFLFCDFYLANKGRWAEASRGWRWDILALLLWPLVWMPNQRIAHILLPFAMALLFVTAFRGRFSSAFFSKRLLTSIGGMCYTIYLYHFLLIASFGKVTKRLYLGGGFLGYYLCQVAVMLPLVFSVCAALYLLIERPCMDKHWPRNLIGTLRGARFASESAT